MYAYAFKTFGCHLSIRQKSQVARCMAATSPLLQSYPGFHNVHAHLYYLQNKSNDFYIISSG